jgi:hypothetical protein
VPLRVHERGEPTRATSTVAPTTRRRIVAYRYTLRAGNAACREM